MFFEIDSAFFSLTLGTSQSLTAFNTHILKFFKSEKSLWSSTSVLGTNSITTSHRLIHFTASRATSSIAVALSRGLNFLPFDDIGLPHSRLIKSWNCAGDRSFFAASSANAYLVSAGDLTNPFILSSIVNRYLM